MKMAQHSTLGGRSTTDAQEETRGGKTRRRSASRYRTGLTAIETAGDAGDDDLEGEETAHAEEDITVLLVDGVDADDVDEGAGGEEDGGADGLEEEEMRALLSTGAN